MKGEQEIGSVSPPVVTRWTNRLAFDVAFMLEGGGDGIDGIMEYHNVSRGDLVLYSRDEVFSRLVVEYRDQIVDGGLSFKLKARVQAEELLVTSWDLIHSDGVSAVVKADLIKATVRWGGLESKVGIGVVGGVGSGPQIVINLQGVAVSPVVASGQVLEGG